MFPYRTSYCILCDRLSVIVAGWANAPTRIRVVHNLYTRHRAHCLQSDRFNLCSGTAYRGGRCTVTIIINF